MKYLVTYTFEEFPYNTFKEIFVYKSNKDLEKQIKKTERYKNYKQALGYEPTITIIEKKEIG